MKVSVNLREDQPPLFKAKAPLSVAGFRLSSGVDFSEQQDLALHLGTCFKAGPSCNLLYKPNDVISPFLLEVKAGFGRWASPKASVLVLSAEIDLSGVRGPFFSFTLTPERGGRGGGGGFCLHKRVNPSWYDRTASVHHSLDGNFRHPEKSFADGYYGEEEVLSPHSFPDSSNGDSHILNPKSHSTVDPDTPPPIGSTLCFTNEGLDGGGERKHDEAETGGAMVGNGFFAEHVVAEESASHKGVTAPTRRWLEGWSAHARSSLPLGNRAKLSIRWGTKLNADLFSNRYGNDDAGFSIARLPFLIMDKITIESISPSLLQQKSLTSSGPKSGIADDELFARAMGLGYGINQELHYLHNENKALQRAVETTRAELVNGWGGCVDASKLKMLLEEAQKKQQNNTKDKSTKEGDVVGGTKSGRRGFGF